MITSALIIGNLDGVITEMAKAETDHFKFLRWLFDGKAPNGHRISFEEFWGDDDG